MYISGPCLFNKGEDSLIINTARDLYANCDYFRVKVWGGGTKADRYFQGIGEKGLEILNDNIDIPFGTEVQTPEHVEIASKHCSFIWVGARNCQNYGLLEALTNFYGMIMIKRSPGITINETINLYDIMRDRFHKEVYIIERGVNTFDRQDTSRWSPDLKGVIRIKYERPDIFKKLVVDCSHSVGKKEYIKDTYKAFKVIGVNHFMFECTYNGKSKTDSEQMLTVNEYKEIKDEIT